MKVKSLSITHDTKIRKSLPEGFIPEKVYLSFEELKKYTEKFENDADVLKNLVIEYENMLPLGGCLIIIKGNMDNIK